MSVGSGPILVPTNSPLQPIVDVITTIHRSVENIVSEYYADGAINVLNWWRSLSRWERMCRNLFAWMQVVTWPQYDYVMVEILFDFFAAIKLFYVLYHIDLEKNGLYFPSPGANIIVQNKFCNRCKN